MNNPNAHADNAKRIRNQFTLSKNHFCGITHDATKHNQPNIFTIILFKI